MKTIKINDTRQPTLTRAVIKQIGGRDSLQDVARHGADGGFPGFTYYTDTVAFAKRHKATILERIAEDCADYGTEGGAIGFLSGFGCLKGMTQDEIGRGLYGPKSDERQQVFNALAWYAAEEIARELNPDV